MQEGEANLDQLDLWGLGIMVALGVIFAGANVISLWWVAKALVRLNGHEFALMPAIKRAVAGRPDADGVTREIVVAQRRVTSYPRIGLGAGVVVGSTLGFLALRLGQQGLRGAVDDTALTLIALYTSMAILFVSMCGGACVGIWYGVARLNHDQRDPMLSRPLQAGDYRSPLVLLLPLACIALNLAVMFAVVIKAPLSHAFLQDSTNHRVLFWLPLAILTALLLTLALAERCVRGISHLAPRRWTSDAAVADEIDLHMRAWLMGRMYGAICIISLISIPMQTAILSSIYEVLSVPARVTALLWIAAVGFDLVAIFMPPLGTGQLGGRLTGWPRWLRGAGGAAVRE